VPILELCRLTPLFSRRTISSHTIGCDALTQVNLPSGKAAIFGLFSMLAIVLHLAQRLRRSSHNAAEGLVAVELRDSPVSVCFSSTIHADIGDGRRVGVIKA
jgi:hypothetical protein